MRARSKFPSNLVAGLLLGFASITQTASAASFDCNRARTPVEKAICGDAELGKLDREMASIYRDLLRIYPVPNYIRARQRDWNSSRQYCDMNTFVNCLVKMYSERIEDLQGSKHALVYANSEKFNYESGDTVAEFKLKGHQVILSLWGAAAELRTASRTAGRTVFTRCEFEALVDKGMSGSAKHGGETQIKYERSEDVLIFGEANKFECEGFSQMPDKLERIPNRNEDVLVTNPLPSDFEGFFLSEDGNCEEARQTYKEVDRWDGVQILNDRFVYIESSCQPVRVTRTSKDVYRVSSRCAREGNEWFETEDMTLSSNGQRLSIDETHYKRCKTK